MILLKLIKSFSVATALVAIALATSNPVAAQIFLEDWQFNDINGTALNAVANTGTTGTGWNFGGPQVQNGSLNIGDATFFKYDVGTGETFRTAEFADITSGKHVFEFVIADWDLSGSTGETNNGIRFIVGDKDDGSMSLRFEVAQAPGDDIRVRSAGSNNGTLSGTDAQNQLGGPLDLVNSDSVTVQLQVNLDTGIWSTRVDAGSDGSFEDLVTDGTGMNSLDRIQLVMDGGANGWEYGGVAGTAEDFIKIDSVTLSEVVILTGLEDWQFDDENGTALNVVANTGTTGTAFNFGGPQTQNGSLNIGDATFFKFDVGTGQTFRTADFADITSGQHVFEFVIADWDLSGSLGETNNGIIFKVGDKDDGIMNLEFEVAQSPGDDIRVRSANSNNGSLGSVLGDQQNQLFGNDLGGPTGTTNSVTVQLLTNLDTGVWSTRVDFGSGFMDLVTDGTGMNSLDRIQLVMEGGANGWEYGGVAGVAEDFVKIDSVTLSKVVLLGDANGDGVVDFVDVSPFLQALFDRAQYELDFPGIDADVVLDINCDGVQDFVDVSPFLGILFP